MAKIFFKCCTAATSSESSEPTHKFGDDKTSNRTALRCAKLSQLAYKSYSVVLQELSKYGLQAEMEIRDRNTDTEGFIASDSSSIIVVFRGSSTEMDIITDMKFKPVPIGPDLPLAHEGFVAAVNAVYTSTEEKLKPHLGQKQLFITGHSLGAALASLLSYRLSMDHPTCQPNLYAFACPPVGDENFCKSFQGRLSNIITIDGDPLSTGPVVKLGEKVGLHKPVAVKYLPEHGGHAVAGYIEQLEKLVN